MIMTSNNPSPRWIVALVISYCMAVEKRLQRKLTQIPKVYHQDTRSNNEIVSLMSSILLRKLRPSLFIGTRSVLNTISAVMPRSQSSRRIREVTSISYDGAHIALDWEIPSDCKYHDDDRLINGPIRTPIILILHGINNDTSTGYMCRIMHGCTEKGYITVGMNARGAGGIDLATPRLHHASYTNDVRDVITKICSRMDSDIPMILVGFSMGANTLVKLLGEYGVSKINQLPKNVIGAVSIGNPLKIHDNGIKKPLLSHAVRLGVKKTLFKHRKQIMKNPDFKNKFKELLFSSTLNEMTSLRIGNMHRNENVFPFANKIGYNSVQEYWDDASSYKYISNVPIPLVVAFADDDDIANTHTKSYMNYGLSNPNVIFVSTASGGHLGYHHARYNNPFGSWNFSNGDGDWGSMLILKFADVVIRKKFHHESVGNQHFNRRMMLNDTLEQAKILKSRL